MADTLCAIYFVSHRFIMTREEKLETIVKLFAKNMFYGDWEWETPNERVITMLMKEVGMYPFKNEDDMIDKTPVDEELYQKAIKEIPTRQGEGDKNKTSEQERSPNGG